MSDSGEKVQAGTFEPLEAEAGVGTIRSKPLCTNKQLAIGGAITVTVLVATAIIIFVLVPSGSSETSTQTPESSQYSKDYATSSELLKKAIEEVLPGNTGLSFDISINEELFVGKSDVTAAGFNVSALKAVNFLVGPLDLKNMTEVSVPAPTTLSDGTACTKCNGKCGSDKTTKCSKTTGQCDFGANDINLFAVGTNCPSYLCNKARSTSMINIMFEGFPNRKNYTVDPLNPPADVSSAGAGLVPERLFTSKLKIGQTTYNVITSFFTPLLAKSNIGVAVRVDVTGKNFSVLKDSFPVLNGVQALDTMCISRGVVVISTVDYNWNGYDVVAGVNVFLRVSIPSNSGYDFLLLKSTPASDFFNMRLRYPIGSVVGDFSKVVLEFQKDLDVAITQNFFNKVDRVGFQVPYNTTRGSVLGAHIELNLPLGLNYKGMVSAPQVTGPTELKVAAYSFNFPSVVTSMFTINQLGLSVKGDLNSGKTANKMNFTAKVTPRLGSWTPKLEVLGSMAIDQNTQAVSYSFMIQFDKQSFAESMASIATSITGSQKIGDVIENVLGSGLFPSQVLTFSTTDFAEINGVEISAGFRLYQQITFSEVTYPDAIQDAFNWLNMKPGTIKIGFHKGLSLDFDYNVFFEFEVEPVAEPSCFAFKQIAVALSFNVAPIPPDVEIAIEFRINLKDENKQYYAEPLRLIASAGFEVKGFKMTGMMLGTWHNVAGIRNFDISNMVVTVKLAVGPVVTGAGIAGSVQLKPGSFFKAMVFFIPDDFVFGVWCSVQNWGWLEIFELMQKLSGQNLGVVGPILTQLSLIRVNSLNLTLAPLGLQIPTYNIPPGFGIQADMDILGGRVIAEFGILSTRFQTPNILGYDFKFSFNMTNVNVLKALVPGLGFISFLMSNVQKQLEDWSMICGVCDRWDFINGACLRKICIELPFFKQIANVLNEVTKFIDTALVINKLYMTNISLAGLVQGDNVINLGIDISVFNWNYNGAIIVDLAFFIQETATVAKDWLKKLVYQILEKSDNLAKVVLSALKTTCTYVNDKLRNYFGCITADFGGPFGTPKQFCFPTFC